MARAQQGAEQLLASAGLGEDQINRVAEAIVRSTDQSGEGARQPGAMPASPSAAIAQPMVATEPSSAAGEAEEDASETPAAEGDREDDQE
jgi:hypothetical protein